MVYTDGIHVAADSLDELHAFMESAGVKRAWFDNHPRHPHYDVPKKMREEFLLKEGLEIVRPRDVLAASKLLS